MPVEEWSLIAAVLLFASVLAWKVSNRLGVPALLLFLGIGMLAGSDGPGGIYFDNASLAQSVGVLALILILFSGGLDTHWEAVRPVLSSGVLLATVGVVVTAGIVGLGAFWIVHLSLLEGLLLGAIISATDAAAVFSVLRGRKLRLRGALIPLLELESGSNDPTAVVLTIGLIRLLANPHQSALQLGLLLLQQMAVGAACGLLIGWGATWLLTRLHFDVEGLYAVLTIALVLFSYGLTATLGGSGFLAVYLVGLLLGNRAHWRIEWLARFHEGVAWLMQIGMFLTLGLLVFPSRLPGLAVRGLLLTAVAIFVARPVAVLVALLPDRLSMRAKLFVSWAGLRGAAPIVLATFPLLAGLPEAPFLFDLVFFIVLASVLVQGTSLSLVARLLRVVSSD